MIITTDTNVLISATFWYGASFQIMRLVEEGKIKLVISIPILEEFSEVLDYDEIKQKIEQKGLEMKMTVAKVRELATIVHPTEHIDVVKEDPDDNQVLECALAGNAQVIISNDKHLLKIKQYKDIQIMTPEEFLKEFQFS